MNPVNTSTKRTAVNAGVITAVVALVCRVTGWQIELSAADLVLAVPAVSFVVGFGYRVSRAITAKWPNAGYVLFGSGHEPRGLQRITKH